MKVEEKHLSLMAKKLYPAKTHRTLRLHAVDSNDIVSSSSVD